MSDNEKLAQNLLTAKRQLRELERKKFAERQSLIDQIEAAFADDLAEANKRVNEARKALQDYAVANAAHPLLGKKVARTIRELHRFSTVKYTDTPIFGLCEVFTFSMPRRAGYCYHSPGDIVVRVLKKDGTPGLTIETVKDWRECE